MTPTEIETRARRMLNVVGSKFWSSEEIINDYLYAAATEMALETLCIENRYTTTSVADQQEYAAPTRMLSIKRITYDGQKLKPMDFQRIDAIDLNSTSVVTGTPAYYYNWDEVFGLYPAPDTAAKTIKIYTYDEPDTVTSSSTLEIPTQFHHYLVYGVAYMMTLKELGHPHTALYERMWNSPANHNNAIMKVKRSIKLRNRDNLNIVKREEDLASTYMGAI
tara:strand:- start:565 stop:1227 length:663 start_codon:yes stop_codon:yes gene_type:complete